MHSGNLGLSQGLETLVEAAALLREVPDIQVVFQGEGVKKADLVRRVHARGLSNVTFLPYQPKERLSASPSPRPTCSSCRCRRGLAGYIVPSKLYGVLAAGRPYVAAVEEECEVAAITRAHACGLVAEPGSPRDLADKILTFYRDRAFGAQAGANARCASLSFDRALEIRRYFELCRDAAAPRAPHAVAAVGAEEVR